jgi:Cu2+-exporting ATPase
MNHDEHNNQHKENTSMDYSKMNHSKMDHSKMNMTKEEHAKMDHSKIDHGAIPIGMAGHDHHKMKIMDFRKRFWVSLIITIPILILNPMISESSPGFRQFEKYKYF